MSEINNNVNKIRFNNIDSAGKVNDRKKMPAENSADKDAKEARVPDTGVLGRSQLVNPKGLDCSQSVDEAVALAQEHPEILSTGDELFDSLYQEFLDSGMKPSEAYSMASMGIHEFMEIATPKFNN